MRRVLGRFDPMTLIVVALAVLLVAGYWATVRLSEEYYVVEAPAGSVFSASPEGLRVLFGYLDRLGVERDTLQQFEELPGAGTIVVVAPRALEKQPTSAETRRLQTWVEEGGRLVLIGPQAGEFASGAFSGSRASDGEPASLEPRIPAAFLDGVGRISVDGDRVLLDSGRWATHVKDTSGQVLATRAVGRGHVVWLSSAYPLSNEGIGLEDNARLATLLVAIDGPVWFDEYHHGFVRGVGAWERLGAAGRAATVLAVVALGVLLAAVSRRLGQPIEVPPARAARTGAYMASLAELYRKAGARSTGLATLAEGLRESLVRRYGTLEVGLARHPSAATTLRAIESIDTETLSEDRFVGIARDIARARQEVEGRDG